MAIMKPELIMKAIIPVVMAGESIEINRKTITKLTQYSQALSQSTDWLWQF